MHRLTCLRNWSDVRSARAYPKSSTSRGISFRFHSWKSVGQIFFIARLPSQPKMQMEASREREMGENGFFRTLSPASDASSSESEFSSVGARCCIDCIECCRAQDGRLEPVLGGPPAPAPWPWREPVGAVFVCDACGERNAMVGAGWTPCVRRREVRAK